MMCVQFENNPFKINYFGKHSLREAPFDKERFATNQKSL